MTASDTQTIINLIAGNKENDAYKYMYEKYQKPLLRFAISYLKMREPAEEIVNDVFLKVWANRKHIAEIINLRIYLFSSVRNACLTSLLKDKREKQIASNLPFTEVAQDDPESLFTCSELNTLIRQTIQNLPPRCRQVYQLVRIEGLKNKEVATKLNISVNTIDVQLAIAVKRLVTAINLFNQRK
jgi:RNA polymerase sigma-70 factor (family 1)